MAVACGRQGWRVEAKEGLGGGSCPAPVMCCGKRVYTEAGRDDQS